MSTLLIIDDDRDLRRAVRGTLTAAGFEILEAGGANEGVGTARHRLPDLILCDLHLGAGSGWDVLTELRRAPATEAIPLILITASDEASIMRQSMDLGADDFLHKPFTRDQLLAAVQARLRKQGVRRTQAEQANQQLLGLLEATGDLVAIVDPPTSIVRYMNRAARRLTGLDPARGGEPVRFSELYPPGRFSEIADHALPSALRDGAWRGETDLAIETGGHIDVLQEILAHRAPDGSVDYVSVVAHDITVQKQSTQLLQRERILLRTLLDALPYCIYAKDREGRRTLSNHANVQALGAASEAEVLGKSDQELLHGPVGAACHNEDLSLIGSGKAVMNRHDLVALAEGEQRWLETTKLPLKDETGQIIGLVGISHDITERKLMERDLRQSEERFRLLFESSTDAMMTTSPSLGRFTACNQAAVKLFGVPDEASFTRLTPSDLSPAVQPDGRASPEQAQRMIQNALLHGSHFFEWRHKRLNGTEFPATVLLTRLDVAGEPLIQATVRDITEAKRAEAERNHMELQLRHAQKLQAIGHLAAGIAHEINTPVQFIGDNTRFLGDSFGGLDRLLSKCSELIEAGRRQSITPELLAEAAALWRAADVDYLRAEFPAALRQTLEGVDRITRIVRAMKDFSHPGTDEKAMVDLNQLVESTLTVCRNEWKYVADLVTDFDSTLTAVPCLPGEFNQVILNLVVNAAHAIADTLSPGVPRKGTLRVSTRRTERWAEVRIADTGTGIPDAVRPHIFEPFFTTKDVGRGTGQGLAIAHSVITDKHGGTLRFETEVGKGTTFILRLPLVAPLTAGYPPQPVNKPGPHLGAEWSDHPVNPSAPSTHETSHPLC